MDHPTDGDLFELEMSVALVDYQTLVASLVRDDAGKISSDDRDVAIEAAAIRYSKDRPRDVVEDVTSADGQFLPLPTGWEDDFSAVRSLEYPIGSVPPDHLSTASWGMYNAPGGWQIMLIDSLDVGALVRMTYTQRHVIDATHDTVPVGDREAVACWAAANLCDQLATAYSGDSDSTIQADVVNHGGKASEFSQRASKLRKRYLDELGIDSKRIVAAGAVVDWDLPSSQGRDRLTHPARYR